MENETREALHRVMRSLSRCRDMVDVTEVYQEIRRAAGNDADPGGPGIVRPEIESERTG